MRELSCASGPLFMNPDSEAARAFFRQKKRALTNKLLSVREAVTRFVKDGDYIASGGFGSNRIATAILHEILRQKKRNLGFAGHTTTHDFQIVAAGNMHGERLIARLDLAYVLGLEARGLSPHSRRVVEAVRSRFVSGQTSLWPAGFAPRRRESPSFHLIRCSEQIPSVTALPGRLNVLSATANSSLCRPFIRTWESFTFTRRIVMATAASGETRSLTSTWRGRPSA